MNLSVFIPHLTSLDTLQPLAALIAGVICAAASSDGFASPVASLAPIWKWELSVDFYGPLAHIPTVSAYRDIGR